MLETYIKNAPISLLISFMLLTPVINVGVPFLFKTLDFYGNVFFISYLCLRAYKQNFKCNTILVPIFFTWVLLFAQVCLLETIYGFSDSTGFSMLLRSIITILAAVGCAKLLVDRFANKSLEFFIQVILFCAILQGFVLWLTFLNPNFRDFMSVLFYRDLNSPSTHLFELRTPGFVPNGGDGLSMNQALLCIVGLMGFYMNFGQKKYSSIIVLLVLFSMLATTFAGRTGLYLGILFSLIILTTQRSNFRISPNLHKIPLFFLVIFSLVFVFKDELGSYGQKLYELHGYEYPLVRLLRGFIDLQQYGQYGDATVSMLLTDMVVIPDDPLRFLFGNNDFGQATSNLIHSDVGYFRLWHGIGFFGLFLFILGFYGLPIALIHLKMRSILVGKIKLGSQRAEIAIKYHQMLIFVLMLGLIGHYKIIYLSTRIYLFVFVVLLLLVDYQYREILASRLKGLAKGNVCVG